VNDPELGCLVEGGNQRGSVFATIRGILFGESAELTNDSAIAQRSARTLPGTFGSGFGVGHCDLLVDGEARGRVLRCQGGSLLSKRSDFPNHNVAGIVDPATIAGMDLFWWMVVVVLMAIGLIGAVLPIFPGTTVILGAAVLHRIILGPEKSIGWPSLGILVALTLASYALDLIGSWYGARRFGATRWGLIGAIAGAIIGLFFGLPGLLLGPIIGAFGGEIVGGKRLIAAGRASWGALLGNVAGTLGKLLIALAMICWFLVAVPAPF